MSTENNYKWIFVIFVAIIAFSNTSFAQDEHDEILTYYKTRASEVFDGKNPIISGTKFSFEAKRYYKIFDKHMNEKITDSVIAHYYYSFGVLDSILTIVKPEKAFDSLEINYPNVFKSDYYYNFFPNDTGGNDLAIGYDSHNFDTTIPVGIAIIDRDNYFLKQLYLHYMAEKKIDRKSKAIRFIELEGFVFPDSIYEIESKSGIFSTEYFRIETGISNIQIQR